ncbi:MAG: type IV secretory system conjugative DNA transfer family protein, partial [Clostridia bacterium]|nr:type IV secretory system conjugative DNA transfer family protein [Clostridia bacterium]
MNRQENTKNLIIIFASLSAIVVWLALIVACCYRDGMKLPELLQYIAIAVNQPLNIHLNEYSLKFVLVFLISYVLGVTAYFSQRENRRPGEEHGSAKWGNIQSVARKYIDKKHRYL